MNSIVPITVGLFCSLGYEIECIEQVLSIGGHGLERIFNVSMDQHSKFAKPVNGRFQFLNRAESSSGPVLCSLIDQILKKGMRDSVVTQVQEQLVELTVS